MIRGKEISDDNRRFPFGKNWNSFLNLLDEDRIFASQNTLKKMLAIESLAGKTFLDVGSGSGLSSLAARRLGAVVYSFDFDSDSVVCTEEIRNKYFPNDTGWKVEKGSVLDAGYLTSLGQFDIVYSWGVLHHTGNMWQSLSNVAKPTATNGLLFIAIYNDQGWTSDYWKGVKRLYNKVFLWRWLMILFHAPYLLGIRWGVRLFTGRLRLERGMDLWRDMLDWLGGYPFEVATPLAITKFFRNLGFEEVKTNTCGRRHGCNEFIFKKLPGN